MADAFIPPKPIQNVSTLRDIVGLAIYGYRTILAAFLLVFAIGAIAALNTRTEYIAEARAIVLVSNEQTGDSGAAGPGQAILSIDALRVVSGEMTMLLSRAVVLAMVDKIGALTLYPKLGDRRWFGLRDAYPENERADHAVELVMRDLSADVIKDSTVIGVRFRHPDPEIAARAVNSLIDEYLELRRRIFEGPATQFLTVERDRFSEQLTRIDDSIMTVKRDNQVVDLAHDILLATNQVDSIIQRRRQILERQAGLEAEIALTRGRQAATPLRVFDFAETTNQAQNDDDRNVLLRLLLEEDKLARQYTSDYPRLAEVRRQIDVVRRSIRSGEKPKFDTRRDVRNPQVDYLATQLVQQETESNSIAQRLNELERQLSAATDRVNRLRDTDGQLLQLDRTRKLIDSIYVDYARRVEAARADDAAAKSDYSNVRIVQWAVPPPTGTSLALGFIAIGIVGGLMAGAAAGMAATWLRPNFILPSEVERRLGLPALVNLGASAEPGGQNEEMATLAATLADRAGETPQHLVVELAAANDDDGLAVAAAQLARELAEGQEVSVAVIDIAGALPRGTAGPVERIADIDFRTGPAGKGRLCIATSIDAGIFASPRAVRRQVRSSLAALRDRFDVVLIVAPPMVRGQGVSRLAALSDLTILVMRASHTRALSAQRLREAVADAGGDIIGFIFTDRRFFVPEAIARWL